MKVNYTHKVTEEFGPLFTQVIRTSLQDFGNKKTSDFLKKDAPKVVNK